MKTRSETFHHSAFPQPRCFDNLELDAFALVFDGVVDPVNICRL